LKLLKHAAWKALDAVGYRLSRAQKADAPEWPLVSRTVLNAHYRGHCFKCFAGDYLGRCILTGEGWDLQMPEILGRLRGTPGAGRHVVEVGANIGASLVPVAGEFPELTFHCVEPVPAFFELLVANVASFAPPNVAVYDCAISSREGDTLEIFTQVGTAGAVAQYDIHTPLGSVRRTTRTLDGLFADKDVGLVKIDVDGFELAVLEGARGLFARCRPMCFLEFHTKLMREVGVDPRALTGFFQEQGYDRIDVYSNSRWLTALKSFPELLELAARTPHYVDVLLARQDARP
jgi:FkbM family methyltransferase